MSKSRIWNAIKLSMTMIGTTIGAGFASGREIWEFFGSYGEKSHWGLLLSMLLFLAASIVILYISFQKQTDNYSELLGGLMGNRMSQLFDILVFIYLITTTIVMIAGSGATFAQWDLSYLEGSLVMIIAVFVVICFDVRGLMSINVVIMPLLLFGLLGVCIDFFQNHEPTVDFYHHDSLSLPILPSAVTYAAFNTISLIAVLSTMGKSIQHPSEIWVASSITVGCLGVVAYLYNRSLLQIEHLISQYEIPLFALVQDYSPFFLFVISCVLWLAIYTTTVSNLHGMVFRLSATFDRIPRWLLGLIILILLTPLSQFGFSSLVQILYPLYGVLNLFLLAVVLLNPFLK